MVSRFGYFSDRPRPSYGGAHWPRPRPRRSPAARSGPRARPAPVASPPTRSALGLAAGRRDPAGRGHRVRRRLRARHLPRPARRQLADLRRAADRPGRAHARTSATCPTPTSPSSAPRDRPAGPISGPDDRGPRPSDGGYWTPNGNHRLAALRTLGARSAVAIVVPEPEVAHRILLLNTEKAHNLRERALEVARLAESLASSTIGPSGSSRPSSRSRRC